ncbi:ubiquinol-cytochrome c reductase iron-sulfur subunit [Microvirga sp. TS319]|uniref:ubiquinol-cytochrome c reductase iron-sulfur subunit n=1 Tax=Microvirga sp. TS319 TaxID=3241165 RepID=UPI00351A2D6D
MSETRVTSVATPTRRDFLFVATGAAAAVGTAATIWPFISSLAPDASTIAAGAPVDVDLAPIAIGQIVKVFWRGKLVFVRHRNENEIAEARATPLSELIDPQTDQERVKPGHAEWLIVFGNCTHLGCVPLGHQGPYDGWFCPCHGSLYDTSGRVRRGPAPLNLPIPPYEFVSDTKIQIGQDASG